MPYTPTVKLYPGREGWRWWCKDYRCNEENVLDYGLEDVEDILVCDACGKEHENDGPISD